MVNALGSPVDGLDTRLESLEGASEVFFKAAAIYKVWVLLALI